MKVSSAVYNVSLRPLRFVTCLIGFSHTLQLATARRMLLWKYLHLLAICALICFLGYQQLVHITQAAYHLLDIFSRVVDFLGLSVLYSMHIVAQVEHSCKSAHCERIFRELEKLRLQFRRDLKVTVDLLVLKRCSGLLYLLFALYCLIVLLLIALLSSDGFPVGRLLVSYYSEVVLRAKFFEFMLLVMLVSVMLRELHRATRTLMQQLEVTRFDAWQQRRCCLARVFALQDAHATLWEIVRLIEDYMAWTLPGLILKQFLDTTLLLYWSCLTLPTSQAVVKIYCFSSTFMQSFILWVVTIICSKCEKWDRKINEELHGVATDRRNPYLGACLRRVSLQLLHEPIHLSAGGFVDINTGTFSKFMFSVTMYTVIVIQFRMSVFNE